MFRTPAPLHRKHETSCRASDEGGGDDGIDYSADPITAFLGKFLPKEEKSKTPQAAELVSVSYIFPRTSIGATAVGGREDSTRL